jgi:hypothetical protein
MCEVVNERLARRLAISVVGAAEHLRVVHRILRQLETHDLVILPVAHARVLWAPVPLAARAVVDSPGVLSRVRQLSIIPITLLLEKEIG